jgi:hypothetical protein
MYSVSYMLVVCAVNKSVKQPTAVSHIIIIILNYIYYLFYLAVQPIAGYGLLVHEVS